ncbi:MAG TPA: metallophosphoesterase [Sphingomicrobium sp.]|nr:metallophosphoesterase [Sphingomicrobium sp.]
MPRLIHLSDLHFGAHDPVLVTAVERRIDEEAPDLVVISGDFTQRARIEQFKEAGAFLMRIRDAGHEVLAVPGNHDVPLYDVLRRFLSPLTRYRRFIDDSLCPFIAIPGAAVLGINTARSLTFKNGHVSHEQMQFIRETFAKTNANQPRILVTHHPLFALPVGDGPELGHVMDDQEYALDAIADAGVNLLLAGHNHRASANDAASLATGAGKALVIQAGTATSTRTRDELQSFNEIEIDSSGVRVTIQRWDGNQFVSGDSQFFERHHERWEFASGEPVEAAPTA